MKKHINHFAIIALLVLGVSSCNNDDDFTPLTTEEIVNNTNSDVNNFLNSFTINDKEIFTNGVLNDGVTESDIRFVALEDDGTIPKEVLDIASEGIKLNDLIAENNRPLGLPQLKRETINVASSSLKQTYFYMILRQGGGRKVYNGDPSLIKFQAPTVNNLNEKTKLLNISDSDDLVAQFISPFMSSIDFTAFDKVRSKLNAGVEEINDNGSNCFDGKLTDTIINNSGVALMIVPGTLAPFSRTGQRRQASFVYTFTIINTKRTDPDGDGILTIDEDLDQEGEDGFGDVLDDDTDKDGIPNYLDADDDGDGISTSIELKEGELVDNDDQLDTNCSGITNDDFRLKENLVNPDYLIPNMP